MMTRIVLSASAGALALAALAAPASAQAVDGPEVTWRLSTWGPPRGFTAGVERLAEIVDERTGGNFTIDIAYGEALSMASENLDGIQIGAFEMAMLCNFYHPGKNPALMVMSLPFLPIPNQEVSMAVRKAVLDSEPVKEELGRWNAVPYASTLLPQYEILGKGEPPEELSDWEGLRVRAGGGLGDAMATLGAVPTTIPAPEVYTALQRGTIDAASLPFSYAHVAYKIPEVSDWFTTNLSPGSSDCPIVISENALEQLPEQYRQLLMDAREEVYDAYLTVYEEIDEENLPMLEEELEPITYTDEQLAKFREQGGRPVWEEWVAENEGQFDAQDMLDLVLQTAEEASGDGASQ